MTPKNLLQRYMDTHGLLFGITRLDYQRTGKGYWVRLGWKDNLPVYQEAVYDQDCGGKDQALTKAITLRDEAFLELAELGVFTAEKTRRSRPCLTCRNKTGIPGMSLQKNKSKTGAGVNYTWKVNWRENKHPKGRSFAFATFDGDGCQAFIAGALCRMDADLRVYGFSEIDPEEQSLRKLYRQAMEAYGVE